MRILLNVLQGALSVFNTSPTTAQNINGKTLYSQRCSMCHGVDIKGTGRLAKKSNPSTPDLTTAAFVKRINIYPGVIVASIILRQNSDLIPRTLRENSVKFPRHVWSVNDLRDIDQYMSGIIKKRR